MSKTLESSESSSDEKTQEDIETPVQSEDDIERGKSDLLTDTTVLDLPFELLERILVEAVFMEVKKLKLVKRVWKEKADLVVKRLKTVCSQWSNILRTKSFRVKLRRMLEDSAQTIRLDKLREFPLNPEFRTTTTLKDDMFVVCTTDAFLFVVKVYNRNDLETVKDIFPIRGHEVENVHVTGCSVSNCVYVGVEEIKRVYVVIRISKESGMESKYKMLPWISDHKRLIDKMRVSANGSIMFLSVHEQWGPHIVSIYSPNGSLQREVMLPLGDGCMPRYHDLFLKSNGNLVVASFIDTTARTQLLEIDKNGNVERQYAASYTDYSVVEFDSNGGRFLIVNLFGIIELLDSEFNLLCMYRLQQDASKTFQINDWQFNCERNEFTCNCFDEDAKTEVLTNFRFTEE